MSPRGAEAVGPALVALAGYDRAVATAPGQVAIEAVARPLEFAARDDFAHVDRVKDLEKSVSESARVAAEAAIPKPAKDALRAVRDAFAKPLSAAELRPAIEKALACLAPFLAPDYPEQALADGPERLPGLGPKRAETLVRRGLHTVADLLFYLPARYDDRRTLQSVGGLEVGRRPAGAF